MSSINTSIISGFKTQSRRTLFKVLVGGAATIGGATYLYNQSQFKRQNTPQKRYDPPGKKLVAGTAAYVAVNKKGSLDYQKIYNEIAQKLQDEDEYDDGSYGPILVRMAWHQSGTYRKHPKFQNGCPYSDAVGGSFAGTMRFDYEAAEFGNTGLHVARDFLKEFKEKHKDLSYGDLYTLAGVVAVQELGGPQVKWRPGRQDLGPEAQAPHGRLPDASQGADHIRELFGPHAMGFNDQEIVALVGAHCLGRCHSNWLGFDGPWTFSPTMFTNAFFDLLANEKWHLRKWDGPAQYQDDATNSLMMLPADYALIEDEKFKPYVLKYAKDQDLFFKDFSKAFQKLLELGIEYPAEVKEYTFKTLDEQE